MIERIVPATVRGRYLTIAPATSSPAPMLVGFHGYGEDGETQLARLQAIPGSDRWLIVSIEAVHRFYQRRNNQVVASWMTSRDREAAIADNVAYVSRCLDQVAADWPTLPTVVFAGFSQGVAMAFRAAVNTPDRIAGVIAAGGDVPPEITPDALRNVRAVLIARGGSDNLYPEQQFALDQQRLHQCSVTVHAITLNAGHEWSSDLNAPAAQFIRDCDPRSRDDQA